MPSQLFTDIQVLQVNLAELPALLDAEGVRKHLAPVGRTLLYNLAASGEIQTASLGLGRGKRVFVTESVVLWLQRRMASTKRPRIATRQSAKQVGRPETTTGGSADAGQQ